MYLLAILTIESATASPSATHLLLQDSGTRWPYSNMHLPTMHVQMHLPVIDGDKQVEWWSVCGLTWGSGGYLKVIVPRWMPRLITRTSRPRGQQLSHGCHGGLPPAPRHKAINQHNTELLEYGCACWRVNSGVVVAYWWQHWQDIWHYPWIWPLVATTEFVGLGSLYFSQKWQCKLVFIFIYLDDGALLCRHRLRGLHVLGSNAAVLLHLFARLDLNHSFEWCNLSHYVNCILIGIGGHTS